MAREPWKPDFYVIAKSLLNQIPATVKTSEYDAVLMHVNGSLQNMFTVGMQEGRKRMEDILKHTKETTHE